MSTLSIRIQKNSFRRFQQAVDSGASTHIDSVVSREFKLFKAIFLTGALPDIVNDQWMARDGFTITDDHYMWQVWRYYAGHQIAGAIVWVFPVDRKG